MNDITYPVGATPDIGPLFDKEAKSKKKEAK